MGHAIPSVMPSHSAMICVSCTHLWGGEISCATQITVDPTSSPHPSIHLLCNATICISHTLLHIFSMSIGMINASRVYDLLVTHLSLALWLLAL